MATPFLSEIKPVAFNFAPKGWALCNGQLLPINQNQALFSLLGTTYGGDGRVNFALPDLRGRAPMHMGEGHTLGERAGEENHTVISGELPAHLHTLMASSLNGNRANSTNANPTVLAAVNNAYGPAANLAALSAQAIATVGSSQPHANMMPFLTITFCIALQGIFPSQN